MADREFDESEIIEIETTRPVGKHIPFRIGGKVYAFKQPKVHGLLAVVKRIQANKGRDDQAAAGVAMFDEVERWLFRCMDEDDAAELRARLEDDDDEVDVEHISQVFQTLVGKASGKRPTSPSGS